MHRPMSAAPAVMEQDSPAVQPVESFSASALSSLLTEAELSQTGPDPNMSSLTDAADVEAEEQQQQMALLQSLDDAELVQAATRIQAAFRGRQARRHLAAHTAADSPDILYTASEPQNSLTSEHAVVTAAATAAADISGGEQHDELAVLSDAQLVQAATHIQAVYRGRQARRALATAHHTPQSPAAAAGDLDSVANDSAHQVPQQTAADAEGFGSGVDDSAVDPAQDLLLAAGGSKQQIQARAELAAASDADSFADGSKAEVISMMQPAEGLQTEKSGSTAVSRQSSLASNISAAVLATGSRMTKRSLTSKSNAAGVSALFGSRKSAG